jgi:hypothetical protein
VALPWVRLDTAFPSNPKLLAMLPERDGYRAGLVYVCGLSWAGAHGTAGFITNEALPFIHARQAEVERLVRHGFWLPEHGGLLVNGWAEFQSAGDEELARRDKARKAAKARWDKERGDA